MTRIHALLAALVAGLMLAATARAQDVSWENPGQLGVGQPAVLALVFADTEPAGRIAPPHIDGLTVLGPPQHQTSVSIVNGARSANVTLSFPVRAEREGTITIPSFSVDTAAGTQTVAELSVEVGPATLPGGRHGAATQVSDVVEARLTPARMTPWAGEVFDIDLTVGLTAGRRGQVIGTPAWDKPGVVAEPWSEGKAVSLRNGSGVHFRTRAVAPQAGRIEMAPIQQDVEISLGRDTTDPFAGFDEAFGSLRKFGGADLFDSFFSRSQTTPATVRSNSVQLDVQPLPQPAPAGFASAVGQFEIESSLVPAQPKTGEPVTWTLTLKGTGNWPGGVALPARAVPADFRTLQPKQTKQFASGELFSGALSEDLVMVPNQPGDYTLDPVRFVYFDPATGEYRTIEARPPLLHITGAPIAAPQSQPALAPAAPNRAPAAARPAAASTGEAAAALLPRDPLSGSATARTPIAAAALAQLAAVPFVLLVLYWVALAVRRARLTDPRRPQRQAFARLAPAIERVRRAATADERVAALLAWQHTAVTALGLDIAAPTAEQLDDQRWVDLWAGSERALYEREHALPGGWCDRALSVCTRTRRPRFNPLRAFTLRNLVPKAAPAALVLSLAVVAAPARAADTAAVYTNGDFAAAREQWLARVKEAPSDWIARYNLGLAAAQLGDAPRALAETVAAFVHAPRHDDVRWNAAAFAAAVPGLDHGAAALLAGNGVASRAAPATWQAILLVSTLLVCGSGALLLRRRYHAQPARSSRSPGFRAGLWIGAAALAGGMVLGGTAGLSLRAYGPLADPRAALVAGQPLLRSVPTDAESAPQQKGLAAGTLVVVERDFLGWVKVGLRSGETGWLRHGDIVPLYAPPSA